MRLEEDAKAKRKAAEEAEEKRLAAEEKARQAKEASEAERKCKFKMWKRARRRGHADLEGGSG